MSKEPLDFKKIKEAADDIRTIENFAENHGFDGSYFDVSVSPKPSPHKLSNSSKDWPLLGLFICIGLSIIFVSLRLLFPVSENQITVLLLLCLLSSMGATMCTHLKFQMSVVTIVAAVGMVAFLAIGFGILTPREALDKVEGLATS